MKKTTSFKKVVLCHTGDFKNNVNDKIKMWVEANGGAFEKELSPRVTHLVASKKAWKRLYPMVQQARRMRTVRIVKYDWLEDSLMKKPVRALPEDKYLYERTRLKCVKKSKKQALVGGFSGSSREITVPRDRRIELAGVEFDKARQEFEQDMGTVGFHPHSDKTGFVYIITLLRYDVLKQRFEKYRLKVGYSPPSLSFDIIPSSYNLLHLCPAPEPFTASPVIGVELPTYLKSLSCVHLAETWAQYMQLFESDETPHTYACYVQYTRPGTSRQLLTLAPPGSTWDFAWQMFEKHFKRKVGTQWSNRSMNGIEINLDGENDDGLFQYQAPRIGDPDGLRVLDVNGREGFIDGSASVDPDNDQLQIENSARGEIKQSGQAVRAEGSTLEDA